MGRLRASYQHPSAKSSTGDGSHFRPSERRQGSGSVSCFNQNQGAAIGRFAAPTFKKMSAGVKGC